MSEEVIEQLRHILDLVQEVKKNADERIGLVEDEASKISSYITALGRMEQVHNEKFEVLNERINLVSEMQEDVISRLDKIDNQINDLYKMISIKE